MSKMKRLLEAHNCSNASYDTLVGLEMLLDETRTGPLDPGEFNALAESPRMLAWAKAETLVYAFYAMRTPKPERKLQTAAEWFGELRPTIREKLMEAAQ